MMEQTDGALQDKAIRKMYTLLFLDEGWDEATAAEKADALMVDIDPAVRVRRGGPWACWVCAMPVMYVRDGWRNADSMQPHEHVV